MRSIVKKIIVLGSACTLPFLAGCAMTAHREESRGGPFYAPSNHIGDPSLNGIRRVVMLPTWSGSVASVETAAELDRILITALQRENRFEVVTFPRQEMLRRFHTEAVSAAAALPPELLPLLKREFGADAVLFVDLTGYSAYRPLQVGWRAKLAAIDGSKLLWSFDDSFSASDRT